MNGLPWTNSCHGIGDQAIKKAARVVTCYAQNASVGQTHSFKTIRHALLLSMLESCPTLP
jgi:hypothetical protein